MKCKECGRWINDFHDRYCSARSDAGDNRVKPNECLIIWKEKMKIVTKPRSIVERSSGWWVVDDYGVVEGPFDNKESAEAYVKIYGSDSVYSTKE